MTCKSTVSTPDRFKKANDWMIVASADAAKAPKAPAPFPASTDTLLALLKDEGAKGVARDPWRFFEDYFDYGVLAATSAPVAVPDRLKASLLAPLDALKAFPSVRPFVAPIENWATNVLFPPLWCVPPTCFTLKGKRKGVCCELTTLVMDRLYFADLVWLYYMERMGVFKILMAMLDDFAMRGDLPLPSNAPESVVVETMIREVKSGLASSGRERESTYRRVLGWGPPTGSSSVGEGSTNTAFCELFEKFIGLCLRYYNDRRVANAVKSAAAGGMVNDAATKAAIKDTLGLLVRAMKPFQYGRNYYHTLAGLVWLLSAVWIVKEWKGKIGVPGEYDTPDQYIPAAYDILVARRPITPSKVNPYVVNLNLADDARGLLLDMQLLGPSPDDGVLEIWLDEAEATIESYRSNFSLATGRPLALPVVVELPR